MSAEITPIRICCGQKHHGPVCPDGLVMCCVCFRRVTQDRLAVLEAGSGNGVEDAPILVDMCLTCKRREDQWGKPPAPTCRKHGDDLPCGSCTWDDGQQRMEDSDGVME